MRRFPVLRLVRHFLSIPAHSIPVHLPLHAWPRVVSVASVLVGAAAFAGCDVYVGSEGYVAREEKRFRVSGASDVRLVTFDGSVEVRGWDQPEVVVEVEKRGQTREEVEAIEVHAEQSGDQIRIEARRPRQAAELIRIGFVHPPSAKLIAAMPRRARLYVQSGDGSITVEQVDGRLELRTADGSVRGVDLGGNVHVQTGDGSVSLDDLEGGVDVTTGDGSITVGGRLGTVRLRTGDGSVRVRLEAGSAMTGNWEISTGDGSVTVDVPAEFSADVDAQAADGSVRAEGGIAFRMTGEIDRRTVQGTLGAGGHLLRIRTGDGSIRLRSH